MRTISRTSFIVVANIVWLAMFMLDVGVVLAPDYVAWWRPSNVNGCNIDTYRYDLTDRLFLFGTGWALSAPLMTLIALRLPDRWPHQLDHPWWNAESSSRSWSTAMAAGGLLLWPLTGMLTAPVASQAIIEAARALPLLAIVLYYRAALISNELAGSSRVRAP